MRSSFEMLPFIEKLLAGRLVCNRQAQSEVTSWVCKKLVTTCRATYCTVCVSRDNEKRLYVVVTQVCIPFTTMAWLHCIVTTQASESLLCNVNPPYHEKKNQKLFLIHMYTAEAVKEAQSP